MQHFDALGTKLQFCTLLMKKIWCRSDAYVVFLFVVVVVFLGGGGGEVGIWLHNNIFNIEFCIQDISDMPTWTEMMRPVFLKL